MPLHLIPGTPPPDTDAERVRKRVRAATPPVLLTCRRCNGSEAIETRVGMVLRNGKAGGGTKVLLCATCQRKGERVVLA